MEVKTELRGVTKKELSSLMVKWGEPAYRGAQIFNWIQVHCEDDLAEMHNLPKKLKEKLAQKTFIAPLQMNKDWIGEDGTRKFLLELFDGKKIESVFLKHPDHNTLCVSSQVGCSYKCKFCATGEMGFERNLLPGEIVGQVHSASKITGSSIRNVVFMGMGEPLDNLEAVLKSIELLGDPQGQNIGQRRITISTCGLVPEINKLAALELQCVLAISLHAPSDDLRSKLVPINRRYPLEELLKACRNYFTVSGRRISFEYALIEGVNDRPEQAQQLGALLRRFPAHINILPANPISGGNIKGSGEEKIKRFVGILEANGLPVSLRKSRGQEIEAACGQLSTLEEEGQG